MRPTKKFKPHPVRAQQTDNARRWKHDPVAFITEVLRNPETGQPFRLYPAEATFLRAALTVNADGKLSCPELLFAAPKKSGKSALAALAVLYVVLVHGGPYAEGYCLANDYEQASSRVMEAIARIVTASPALKDIAKITAGRVEFASTGSFIQAVANDYSGFAGANPTITCFDELCFYMSERSRRLFDEAIPSPARKVSVRLTTSTAGFEGESELLEGLYKRGLGGEVIGEDLYRAHTLLMYWTHALNAPWQTTEWVEEARQSLRPNQFLRLIENRWMSTESAFVEMDWFDACVDVQARPIVADRRLPVWAGVDASTKRDSTALVACAWDDRAKQVKLVQYKVFQPRPDAPLDFENTVERSLLEWARSFDVREIRYDPYQMAAVAQRLQRARLPMVEFPQTTGNLTEASTNLYELFKGRNLQLYPSADLRLAVSRAVAVESSRGWRIAKEKASHKIDVVVALAQACLGAVQQGRSAPAPVTQRDLYTGAVIGGSAAGRDPTPIDTSVNGRYALVNGGGGDLPPRVTSLPLSAYPGGKMLVRG